MTKTTQDLHSVRESNERLFALKLNIGVYFLKVRGVAAKSHAPSAAPLRG
jgi:hypothetical protein